MAALERRACDHAKLAEMPPAVDPGGDLLKPEPPVARVERVAGIYFGDVRRRMEVVAFLKKPVEPLRKGCRDRRLAASGDAHHDEDWPNVRHAGLVRCHCDLRWRRARHPRSRRIVGLAFQGLRDGLLQPRPTSPLAA